MEAMASEKLPKNLRGISAYVMGTSATTETLLKWPFFEIQRPNLQLWKAVLICQLMRGLNGGHGLGKIAEKPPRDLRLSHGDKATKEALLKWPFFEIQSSTLHRKKAQTIGYQLRGFLRPSTTSKGPKMAAEF